MPESIGLSCRRIRNDKALRKVVNPALCLCAKGPKTTFGSEGQDQSVLNDTIVLSQSTHTSKSSAASTISQLYPSVSTSQSSPLPCRRYRLPTPQIAIYLQYRRYVVASSRKSLPHLTSKQINPSHYPLARHPLPFPPLPTRKTTRLHSPNLQSPNASRTSPSQFDTNKPIS